MMKLKKLIITRTQSLDNLSKVSQAEYPKALEQYYKTNLELVKSSNDIITSQPVGTVLFEIDGREHLIKSKKDIKYIGYKTIKKVDKV